MISGRLMSSLAPSADGNLVILYRCASTISALSEPAGWRSMLTTSLSVSAQLSQCGNARMECNEFVSLSGQCFYPPIRPMPIEIEGRRLDGDRWPTPCSLVVCLIGSKELHAG